MKRVLTEWIGRDLQHGDELAMDLKQVIEKQFEDTELQQAFVQDLSHISQAAVFSGDMKVDQVRYLKDNLYRCDYSYGWHIAWTCSGTQEAGRVSEKVRFTLNDDAEIEFKFLKLEA